MTDVHTWTDTPPVLEDLNGRPQYFWLRSGACPSGAVVCLNPGVRLGPNGKGLAEISVELGLRGYPEFLWMSELSSYPQLKNRQWCGPIARPAEMASEANR